jgi:hypothetical protein
MRKGVKDKIIKFIEPNIENFHAKRLNNLQSLRLEDILKRKNPYLFKAKNLITASELVKSLLDAHLSSQEEGIFGGFLEELARFISKEFYGGKKSSAEGVDLEFEKRRVKYIVAIKSGPNWGNSQQINRMKDNFRKAKKILRTNSTVSNIIPVNGCCYGRDDRPDKGDYLKLCGQRFWEFISDDEKLYTEIIEPLGHKAKEKNDKLLSEYAKVNNRFTADFAKEYCSEDGNILWEKLVKFNSGKIKNSLLRF